MSTAYVVMSGAYEQRGPAVVFLSRDDAEAYCRQVNGALTQKDSDFHDVEEYDLNPPREGWGGSWEASLRTDGSQWAVRWSFGSVNSPPQKTWGWNRDGFSDDHKIGLYRAYGATKEEAVSRAEDFRRKQLSPVTA